MNLCIQQIRIILLKFDAMMLFDTQRMFINAGIRLTGTFSGIWFVKRSQSVLSQCLSNIDQHTLDLYVNLKCFYNWCHNWYCAHRTAFQINTFCISYDLIFALVLSMITLNWLIFIASAYFLEFAWNFGENCQLKNWKFVESFVTLFVCLWFLKFELCVFLILS